MRKLAAIVCALAFAAGVQAADVGGVKLNDKESVGGQDLVLNGAGIRTKLMFKVYVGSLWLPAKTTTAAAVYAKGPRRVQLNMLRDVTSDQMMEALTEGVTNGNPAADVAAVKAQTGELGAIMKSIGPLKEGNVITFDFVDGATKVGFNGAAKGTIAGEAFNKALMNAWIGDSPVQPDLKKAMLGG